MGSYPQKRFKVMTLQPVLRLSTFLASTYWTFSSKRNHLPFVRVFNWSVCLVDGLEWFVFVELDDPLPVVVRVVSDVKVLSLVSRTFWIHSFKTL